MRRPFVALGIVGVFAACGFPQVGYDTGDGGGPGVDSSSDRSSEAPSSDAGADGNAPGDGPASVDSTASDGSHDALDEHVFEASPDAPACDQDEDGYNSTAPGCNGKDCCDIDSRAHPNQTGFFQAADNCGSFDFNCNSTEDPQYPVNLTCGGTGLTGCTGGSGFTGSPGCGVSGPYGTCEGSGALKCTAQQIVTETQGCN